MSMNDSPAVIATDRSRDRGPRSVALSSLWLTAGAPVAISLVSLLLSVYTIIEANRAPEIWLSAPEKVRIAQGPEEQAWIYAQPRFVSGAPNDRVAVISGIKLQVMPPDGESVTFAWTEQGWWQYDQPNRSLTWMFQADAAPLVVSPSNPQLPICLFESPVGWSWQEGTYRLTIVAARGQVPEALQTALEFTLSADIAEQLNANPRQLFWVRTQPVALAE
jgi:hypothetical protein